MSTDGGASPASAQLCDLEEPTVEGLKNIGGFELRHCQPMVVSEVVEQRELTPGGKEAS